MESSKVVNNAPIISFWYRIKIIESIYSNICRSDWWNLELEEIEPELKPKPDFINWTQQQIDNPGVLI